jgi:hypothetical protein
LKGSGLINMVGTSFPASPSTDDHFWRSDLKMGFYYDGTRWLSEVLYDRDIEDRIGASSASGVWQAGISATNAGIRRGNIPAAMGGTDIWIVDSIVDFFVNAGTALSGSNKWVGILTAQATGASVTLATHTIASGTLSAFRSDTVSVNALAHNGTTKFITQSDWTKTGTPGPLIFGHHYTYRIVAT